MFLHHIIIHGIPSFDNRDGKIIKYCFEHYKYKIFSAVCWWSFILLNGVRLPDNTTHTSKVFKLVQALDLKSDTSIIKVLCLQSQCSCYKANNNILSTKLHDLLVNVWWVLELSKGYITIFVALFRLQAILAGIWWAKTHLYIRSFVSTVQNSPTQSDMIRWSHSTRKCV